MRRQRPSRSYKALDSSTAGAGNCSPPAELPLPTVIFQARNSSRIFESFRGFSSGKRQQEFSNLVFFPEGGDQVEVRSAERFYAWPGREQLLEFCAHPEEIHARALAVSVAGVFEFRGDLFGQLLLNFDSGLAQVFPCPGGGFTPAGRTQFHQSRVLFKQLNEPAPSVGIDGREDDGRKRGRALEIDAQRFSILIGRMTEVFRVGKEKVIAAPQHGYLVGALQFLGKAAR